MNTRTYVVETRQILSELFIEIVGSNPPSRERFQSPTPRAATLAALDRNLESRRRRVRELNGPPCLFATPSEEHLLSIGTNAWSYEISVDETLEFTCTEVTA